MLKNFVDKTQIKGSFLKRLRWKIYLKTGLGIPDQAFLDILERSNRYIADCPDGLSEDFIQQKIYESPLSVYLEDAAARRDAFESRPIERTFQGMSFPLIRDLTG